MPDEKESKEESSESNKPNKDIKPPIFFVQTQKHDFNKSYIIKSPDGDSSEERNNSKKKED